MRKKKFQNFDGGGNLILLCYNLHSMANTKTMPLNDVPLGFSPLSTTSTEFRQMLLHAIDYEVRVQLTLSIPGEGRKLQLLDCRVHPHSKVRELIRISTTTEAPPKDPEREEEIKIEAFGIFFLRQASLLCLQSEEVVWDERGVSLGLPWRAFRFQRRNAPRLEIPLGYEYYAKLITERIFQLRIFDISANGMSVFATERQAFVLPKKTFVRKLSFEVDGNTLHTEAKVVRQAPCTLGNGDVGVRIGIQFESMGAREEKFISAFVARHLIQYSN